MTRIEISGYFAATWAIILLRPFYSDAFVFWLGVFFALGAFVVWILDWYHARLKRRMSDD